MTHFSGMMKNLGFILLYAVSLMEFQECSLET